jgi:hypothetical protein
MSLGKFVYRSFFKPTFWIRYQLYHFGIKNTYAYYFGEADMKKTALAMPSINLKPTTNALSINYLTGVHYWHQTIFGIQSLVDQYGTDITIGIYSDGTLSPEIAQIFKNYCPQINLVTEEQILDALNTIIPAEKYPTLHFLRGWHPFFKRMIDIHCANDWSIHLDSDMLFFKYPEQLVNYSRKKKAFYMVEQAGQSFFCDDQDVLLNDMDIPTLQGVNGGVIAYSGTVIDYDNLNFKAKQLLEKYFNKGPAALEQTLMSYILSTQNGMPLSGDEYKIYYDKKVDDLDNAALRHYIFKAKLPYYTTEWKKIAR